MYTMLLCLLMVQGYAEYQTQPMGISIQLPVTS